MTATQFSNPAHRLRALAAAECRQFTRNPTIMALALGFPLLSGIMVYLLARNLDPVVAAASATEIFVMCALLFIGYYSVVSMTTVRRDENVLKRLRSGEARDWEILAAIVAPGILLTLAISAVFVGVLAVLGAPLPSNPLSPAIALVLGMPLAAALGIVTSAYTRNAEAAQISTLPVVMLAMVSMANLRMMFPDNVAAIVDRTPFALLSKLVLLGWSDSATALSKALPSAVQLAAWTIVAFLVIPRIMKWETAR